MTTTAAPIKTTDADTVLVLNQLAFYPLALRILAAGSLIISTFNLYRTWIRSKEDSGFVIALGAAVALVIAGYLLVQSLSVIAAHKLTLLNGELEIEGRNSTERFAFSAIRSIKRDLFSAGYVIKFHDRRSVRRITGVNVMPFIEELSRRSGVAIEK